MSLQGILQEIQTALPLPPVGSCSVQLCSISGLKHHTIKAYIPLWHQGLANHTGTGQPFCKWVNATAGEHLVRYKTSLGTLASVRLPITLSILQHLREAWLAVPQHPSAPMLWAVMYMVLQVPLLRDMTLTYISILRTLQLTQ